MNSATTITHVKNMKVTEYFFDDGAGEGEFSCGNVEMPIRLCGTGGKVDNKSTFLSTLTHVASGLVSSISSGY